MNALTPVVGIVALPALVQRAADALLAAKSHAEVLEARDLADAAYTAAKLAGRMVRAKRAHDSLLAEVYRAQADALSIEAQAKMRLADEYDAAKAAEEVAPQGRPKNLPDGKVLPKAGEVGISYKQAHDARELRDAEAADPGATERILSDIVARGEEPTKAKLKRELVGAKPKEMDKHALWLWGRLKDFERDGVLSRDPAQLLSEMTEPMQRDALRLAPLVAAFLEELQ